MKKITATLVAFFVFCAITTAQAQNASKTIPAKKLWGIWKVIDMDFRMDESKATEEQKEAFPMIKEIIAKTKAEMVGKATINFSKDGSFKRTGSKGEQTGTWTLAGNTLTMNPKATDENENPRQEVYTTSWDGKILKINMSKEDEPFSIEMTLKK